jgi:hypothetical protein
MLARARSRALDALYNAEVARRSDASASPRSFEQMMQTRGTDLPELARELDIARSVIADLTSGGMRAPVGKRLVDSLMHALAITEDAFQSALRAALHSPRLGHAKVDRVAKLRGGHPRQLDAAGAQALLARRGLRGGRLDRYLKHAAWRIINFVRLRRPRACRPVGRDESQHARGSNPGESIGERARDRHNRIWR